MRSVCDMYELQEGNFPLFFLFPLWEMDGTGVFLSIPFVSASCWDDTEVLQGLDLVNPLYFYRASVTRLERFFDQEVYHYRHSLCSNEY